MKITSNFVTQNHFDAEKDRTVLAQDQGQVQLSSIPEEH